MIKPNEVHVWFADLATTTEADAESLVKLLSEDEYERSRRFAFPQLKKNYIISRAILRLLLSHYIKEPPKEITFYYGEYGKPKLAGNDEIKFSISHSENRVTYAISLGDEVGIDIEKVKDDIYSGEMAQLCLSSGEKNFLKELSFSDQIQSFYSLWTCKEALLKGLGCGLEYPIVELEIDISNRLYPKIKTEDLKMKGWSLYSFCYSDDFKGAIAAKGKEKKFIFKEWQGSKKGLMEYFNNLTPSERW